MGSTKYERNTKLKEVLKSQLDSQDYQSLVDQIEYYQDCELREEGYKKSFSRKYIPPKGERLDPMFFGHKI